MKKFRIIISVMVLALLVVGCSTGKKDSDDGQLKLTFYYPVQVGGPATKIIDQLVADFEVENPGIKIEPVYLETTMIQLLKFKQQFKVEHHQTYLLVLVHNDSLWQVLRLRNH